MHYLWKEQRRSFYGMSVRSPWADGTWLDYLFRKNTSKTFKASQGKADNELDVNVKIFPDSLIIFEAVVTTLNRLWWSQYNHCTKLHNHWLLHLSSWNTPAKDDHEVDYEEHKDDQEVGLGHAVVAVPIHRDAAAGVRAIVQLRGVKPALEHDQWHHWCTENNIAIFSNVKVNRASSDEKGT